MAIYEKKNKKAKKSRQIELKANSKTCKNDNNDNRGKLLQISTKLTLNLKLLMLS